MSQEEMSQEEISDEAMIKIEMERVLFGEIGYIVQYINDFSINSKDALSFLEEGYFQCTEEKTPKEILNYLIKENYINIEKIKNRNKDMNDDDLETMGANIIADSKLNFYPTEMTEIMLSTSMFPISLKTTNTNKLNEKQRYSLDRIRTHRDGMAKQHQETYVELVQARRFDIIQEMYKFDFRNLYFIGTGAGDEKGNLVVMDLFGGDGRWLRAFKNLDSTSIYGKKVQNIITVYNELEVGKYEQYKDDFDFSFNLAAEELMVEMKRAGTKANVILFNPPYGMNKIQKRRNVRYFLQETLKFICSDKTRIALIINREDLIDIKPILRDYDLSVAKRITNDEEFKKLGQFYLEVVTKKIHADANKRKNDEIIRVLLETEHTRIIKKARFTQKLELNFNTLHSLEKLESQRRIEKYTSPVSNADQIIASLIPNIEENVIMFPKKPSAEEVCVLIANGKLNNKVVMDDGNVLYICGVNEKIRDLIEDEEDPEKMYIREVYSTSISIIDSNKNHIILTDKGRGLEETPQA